MASLSLIGLLVRELSTSSPARSLGQTLNVLNRPCARPTENMIAQRPKDLLHYGISIWRMTAEPKTGGVRIDHRDHVNQP
jgi:hypothetical protein